MHMSKAVFLDRDGTINIEKNYLYKIKDFEFIPGSIEAIRILKNKGYKVIIVTNQAGVARGYFNEDDVHRLHEWMIGEMGKCGANIDDVYYCPHHNTYGTGRYKTECECRKPNPGMLLKAMEKHSIDPCLSYTIGDKESDLIAGKIAGTQTVLVKTGYGYITNSNLADFVSHNLFEAAERVVI
jgi:D-glycero-D-manno-heptose 1,7-bisphosphate phosphatase